MIDWPTSNDYTITIQSPQVCFRDPELARSSVERSPRTQMPKVWTGNFAQVYEVQNASSRWAIKCFTRSAPDIASRYAAIAKALQGSRLPCFTEFVYLDSEILINGTRYPVLKMGWVDGEHLDSFTRAHLHDPAALVQLAANIRNVVEGLEQHGMAHGDLQHNNIVICGGEVKLIDYDGMFVPTFKGTMAPENGLPSYQHPRRTAADYGIGLDRFALLVICTALVALATNPALWDRFSTGDNMLFMAEDFRKPSSSALIASLLSIHDSQLAALTNLLINACALPPMDVPLPPPLPAARPFRLSATTSSPGMGSGSVATRGNQNALQTPPNHSTTSGQHAPPVVYHVSGINQWKGGTWVIRSLIVLGVGILIGSGFFARSWRALHSRSTPAVPLQSIASPPSATPKPVAATAVRSQPTSSTAAAGSSILEGSGSRPSDVSPGATVLPPTDPPYSVTYYGVGDVDVPASVVSRVEPPENRTGQTLILSVAIGSDGKPSAVRVLKGVSGASEWQQDTIRAAYQWQFAPARKNGSAVASWFNLAFAGSPAAAAAAEPAQELAPSAGTARQQSAIPSVSGAVGPAVSISKDPPPGVHVFKSTEVDIPPAIEKRTVIPNSRHPEVLVLSVAIDATGKPIAIRILKSAPKEPDWQAEAIGAVSAWRFTPAVKHGKSVASWFDLGVAPGQQ